MRTVQNSLEKTIILQNGERISTYQVPHSPQIVLGLSTELRKEAMTALNEGRAKLVIDTEDTLCYEIYTINTNL